MNLWRHSLVVERPSNITLATSASVQVVAQPPVFGLELYDDREKPMIDRHKKKKELNSCNTFRAVRL